MNNESPIVTTSTIIDWLREQVESKTPIPPSVWLDAAAKLTVLMSDETDELYVLQQKVAQAKVSYMKEDEKHNVSRARVLVEATDEYRQMKQQQAKVDMIAEYIRIAKLQARMRDNEYRLN